MVHFTVNLETMKQVSDFMYFKELADALGISPQTLRKKITTHPNPIVSKLMPKRGTGTYFYSKHEITLLFNTFST